MNRLLNVRTTRNGCINPFFFLCFVYHFGSSHIFGVVFFFIIFFFVVVTYIFFFLPFVLENFGPCPSELFNKKVEADDELACAPRSARPAHIKNSLPSPSCYILKLDIYIYILFYNLQ